MTSVESNRGDERAGREERLVTGYSGRLLLVVSLGWMMIQAGRLVLSPMLPAVMEDLHITELQAGVAFTLLWGLYALGQYPSGRLSDRFSRKTLLVSGLSLLAVGFTVLAGAPTYAVFLLGAAVVGCGAGLYPTPARALVSDLFVSRRGQAFGLHGASGDTGGVIAAGLAVAVLAVAVWRAAFVPVVLVTVLVLVLLHRWSREGYTRPTIDADAGRAVVADVEATARRFGNRRTVALLVAYSLYAFVWQSVAGFLPSFLQESKDFSPELAGSAFAALFIVGTLVKPVSGALGDRISRPVVAAGSLVLATVALAALVLASGTLAVAGSVALFAAGLMAYPPAMQAHLMDVFPDGSMGGDLGATRTVYIGFGSLGTTYVGYVAGQSGYETAFTGLLACLIVSASIVFALARWSRSD
ncbi:MFS transporter (plasmid) [Haladaptatus sp. SPP-AMP-3]|uniref:MFS transporter n=1 Tax=Haladaptatus sp. SPP-AMP-3 TaxID=3121295 RepID=UPI003C2E75EF